MILTVRKLAWLLPVSVLLLLAACAEPVVETVAPAALTATPFGTIQALEPAPAAGIESIPPTATPPPRVCLFPLTLTSPEGATVVEAGVYRFDWRGTPLTVTTRGGDIEITGPTSLTHGARTLIVVHDAALTPTVQLDDNFAPGASLVIAPALQAEALRSPEGDLLRQTILDPADDVRGVPANLDVLAVSRLWGAGDTFTLRVTLRAPDPRRGLYTWESVEALLGEDRYAARVFADGQIFNLYYDASGQPVDWGGTMIIQGPTVTWTFDAGRDQPFGARTLTSAADGDETNFYPIDPMDAIWQSAATACGL